MGAAEWERFGAGALASGCAEVATLPLDCIKTRLQNQRSVKANVASALTASANVRRLPRGVFVPSPPQHQYTGMMDAAWQIVRHEKPTALWKGLNAALARQVSNMSIRMVLYDPLRDFFGGTGNTQMQFHHRFAAGGFAGAIGSALANPLDVIKVRMQCDRSGRLYSGVFDALLKIRQQEGYRALAKGMMPNIQRAFLVNAAELGSYDQCKHALEPWEATLGPARHLIASGAAGFVSAVVSNPLDVIKTRLMMANRAAASTDASEVVYSGVVDCFKRTLQEEGPSAFFKGFWPNWARNGPWCMVFFLSYEQMHVLMKPWTDAEQSDH